MTTWNFVQNKNHINVNIATLYKKIMSDIKVINNTVNQQFEVHMDNEVAVLIYRFYKNDIALMHTEVPEMLEGKGVASTLAKHAFEWAKEHKRKVMVYCPFVAAFLKRHPEYNALVDKKYT
jgi:predicted GNAT family acetyltransferase